MTAAEEIDNIIASYGGWKSSLVAELRHSIKQAHPSVTEEVKWKTASRPLGLPVWSDNGIICIAEIWKDNVKLIFFKGVELKDAQGVFNARLQSKADRAIELREGDAVPEQAIKELALQAVEINKGA
jgi:hypothetical protein